MEPNYLKSFLENDELNEFSLHNIPYGVFLNKSAGKPHCCTRIGNFVVDLAVLEESGLFNGPHLSQKKVFGEKYLNSFMELGRDAWKEARHTIQTLFSENSDLKGNEDVKKNALFPVKEVQMQMPVFIRDYTDFYSSKNHAYNVGCIIRGPNNALQANWTQLPVGYHGRASSVALSGTDVVRPKGQVKAADKEEGVWSECKRLDFELEVGAFIGKSSKLGQPIKIKNAAEHVFGLCIVNDWSARDIQTWEYVPLGPFTAKNFITSISPWVVTTEALEPFKIKLPAQDPKPLPYLYEEDLYSYDMELLVDIQPKGAEEAYNICKSNFKYLYWSINQQLTHHSVTGCNLNVGDMLASGTISGTEQNSFGSLLELSWAGKNPLTLPNGDKRTFILDGDRVVMRAVCKGKEYNIGFGSVEGTVLPALSDDNYF